jgi:hypothetical protein
MFDAPHAHAFGCGFSPGVLHFFVECGLIVFERKHVVPPCSTTIWAFLVWQLAASTVTTQPVSVRLLSTSGTVAISFVSSGTSRWAITSPAILAQALTVLIASRPFQRSWLPRAVLPSNDTTSPHFNHTSELIQAMKQP